MRKLLMSLILLSAFFIVAEGKTINPPKISAKDAIRIAERYVMEKKFDIAGSFLASVEYKNLHNEYEKPFWLIEWRRLSGADLGGETFVQVFNDGTAKHSFGR